MGNYIRARDRCVLSRLCFASCLPSLLSPNEFGGSFETRGSIKLRSGEIRGTRRKLILASERGKKGERKKDGILNLERVEVERGGDDDASRAFIDAPSTIYLKQISACPDIVPPSRAAIPPPAGVTNFISHR